MSSKTSRPGANAASNSNTRLNSSIVLLECLFVLRLCNALSIRTFFQPDEYFQALEPAWAAAFGEISGAWITWEWREHLRSSLHPLLFTGIYKIAIQLCDALQVSATVRTDILIAAPKILQAAFAACIDLFTYRLAGTVYGNKSGIAKAALALTVLSPWQWFCSVRTFSNSLETALTVIALEFWPWAWFMQQSEPDNRTKSSNINTAVPKALYVSLTLAAVACILRPTNLIIWATISYALCFKDGNRTAIMPKLILTAGFVGSAVLVLSLAVDRAYYNEWVFPPLEFLRFNVVESLSVFYGVNRFGYYITEGAALLLTASIPFAAIGFFKSLRARTDQTETTDSTWEEDIRAVFAYAVFFDLFILSLISHKEARFIYPLLPMLHILAARPLATFFDPAMLEAKKYRGILLTLGFALNLVIGYYASYIHQRGVVDVVHYVRHEYEQRHLSPGISDGRMTVGFFMPCHSTPWRSHLVYPQIDAWALTCEPPLGLAKEERIDYLDEADVFYADPLLWIDQNMKNQDSTEVQGGSVVRRAWPEYLAFFAQLEPAMETVRNRGRYEDCWRGFNTHWHDDWRREGDVVVWCRRQ